MDDLENMKYAELQKLAKKVGVKANMKADKLRVALKEHFAAQVQNEGDSEAEPTKEQTKAATPKPKRTPGKSPKAKSPAPKKKETKPSPKSGTPTVAKGITPKGTPKGTPTPKLTPGFKSLNKSGTPLSGIKRLGSKPATPTSITAKKKSTTPMRGTPTQSRKQSNGSASPAGRRSSGRKRSNTYTLPEGTVPSPTVKEMMDSMKDGMTTEELKSSLQNVLEKNAKSAVDNLKQSTTLSSIPRFAAFAMRKKAEAAKKTITPGNKDWSKIHQKQFDKMDSLDVYLEKKRKRTESISASVKKAKLLAEQTKAQVNSLRSCMSPGNKEAKATLFKTPVPHTGVPFVPKVTSTANMNTNFSSMKKPSPQKKTPKTRAVKAPARGSAGKENLRKSPRVAPPKKSPEVAGEQIRKSVGTVPNRKIAVAAPYRKSLAASNVNRKSTSNAESRKETPFKIGTSLNQTLPVSQKKPKFDLKASLSRPMTWKPHTGKLKPVVQENLFTQKAGAFRIDPKNVNIKVQSKDDRRTAQKSRQADKRAAMQMKRRGINV